MAGQIVDRQELGRRLYLLRHMRRWSLADVEQRTGISQSNLSRYERGVGKRYPELERLGELADLYEVSVPDLLGPDWPMRVSPNTDPQVRAA